MTRKGTNCGAQLHRANGGSILINFLWGPKKIFHGSEGRTKHRRGAGEGRKLSCPTTEVKDIRKDEKNSNHNQHGAPSDAEKKAEGTRQIAQ